ncbi:MAG: hypothetical protein A2W85_02065 [Bacteroidetes bacterium GWF2_41_31]|nr:MAG: hypothetical protein A2W85_02065 [Bacteroidetes bacterium GWF2_41_31]
MKKVLLITLTLLVSMSNYGQDKRLLNRFDDTHHARAFSVEGQIPDYTGLQPNEYVADRAQDIIFGNSYYDVQTNSAMPRHLYLYPDGTMGSVWTIAPTNAANWPQRGSGYNYFDGSSWGPQPTARIETVRTGWANYAPYGENGEIVCAHSVSSDGLIFSWRANKGSGDWTYFNLVGPAGHEDILWPKILTTGDNHEIIHVLALTTPTGNDGTIYEGINGALLYSRSTDGGQTWDPENIMIDGLTSDDYVKGSGDSYCWATKDNVIAFAVGGGLTDGMIFKSADGGDSWEKSLFFESPYPLNDGNTPFDGYYGGDEALDLIFDDEGKMHVSFGRTYWSWYEAGPYVTFSYGVDGLIYWNEDKAVLDSTILGDPDALEAAGCLAAWVVEGPGPGDTLMNLTPYRNGMTSAPQMAFHRDANNIPIVTIFYTSYDWKRVFDPTNEKKTYRSVWMVTTEDNGSTWSSFTNLTGDIFHKFSECVYHSIAYSLADDTYHLVFENGISPGTSTGTSPDHPIQESKMVYLPVSPLAVDVNEVSVQSLEISQNYPNPFSGKTYIEVILNEASNVTLEVYTLTGQKVAMSDYGFKTTGSHNLTIDGSQLTTGVYFYTVTAGESKVTRKMMVD